MTDLSEGELIILQLMRQGVTSNKALMSETGWTLGMVAGAVNRLGKKGLVRNREVVEKPIPRATCQYIKGEPPKYRLVGLEGIDKAKCGKPAAKGAWCGPHYEIVYPKRVQYVPKYKGMRW